MVFEVVDKDLLGRLGRLKTKRGVVETPLLLPVVNPLLQPISPSEMEKEFDCEAIIANAYLLKKNFEEEVKTQGIHEFLNFSRVVMTDSGAYQILVYGEVDVTPLEIAAFEEEIDADIAVILDLPTGWNVSRKRAKYTVDETLNRARLTLDSIRKKDTLWVGPIQGGGYLDLVAYSAKELRNMSFQICALGSPTQVMERYLFSILVDMIITAKKNTSLEKPFHLFGAGHPFMFSFAVALGCDMFDSAAYAIYARRDKYMTTYGTVRLRDMEYFPCSCIVCTKNNPKNLREMPPNEREKLLATHNLITCFSEIRRIKQAIREGRLWELLEIRSRSHPSLLDALKRLQKHKRFLEPTTPISKNRGIFFFGSTSLARPQILRHQTKLKKWYPPIKHEVLMLLPQPTSKPFHRSRELKRLLKLVNEKQIDVCDVHFCIYTIPFGVVPLQIDEIYPLSQFEISFPWDQETKEYVVNQVKNYIIDGNHGCKAVVLYSEDNDFGKRLATECMDACSKTRLRFFSSNIKGKTWSKRSIESIVSHIGLALKETKKRNTEIYTSPKDRAINNRNEK